MIVPKIAHSILPHRQLLIGFSGGLDSTVLLHKLKLWRDIESDIRLRAVHIHHGLSSSADSWKRHCVAICREWKIPLTVTYISVVKDRLGIEARARKARYEAFERILLPGETLVTAQHMDDQCETFLIALKRGSGPSGLSAMPMRKKFADTQLLRPLLTETRESLVAWARIHSLRWIEDESNQDSRYDRNFLRLCVIPLLNKRWPHISSAISRSAMLCAEQENLLDELLADELSTLTSAEGALEIVPLVAMSSSRRAALLRRWFLNQGALMPSYRMLDRVWEEVAQARKDAVPCIHLNGYDVRRFRGLLWRVKPQLLCGNKTTILWQNPYEPLVLPHGMGKVSLKEGGHISPPSPEEAVSVRFKASNDTIHIVGRCSGRKLKKIWQELNVPPWERAVIPLLFYGETLIAAAGRFITREGWIENGMCFEKET